MTNIYQIKSITLYETISKVYCPLGEQLSNLQAVITIRPAVSSPLANFNTFEDDLRKLEGSTNTAETLGKAILDKVVTHWPSAFVQVQLTWEPNNHAAGAITFENY